MFKPSHALLFLIAASVFSTALTPAQEKPSESQGLFAGSTDIGATQKGASAYNSKLGAYTITGGGADMWGVADAFHLDWTKLSGDASLTADVQFPSGKLAPLEKAVLIFRQSLDPDSAYADVAMHADGHITLQWRTTAGGKTEDTTSTLRGANGFARLRIERKGDQITIYAGTSGDALVPNPPVTVVLHGPVYVGLGVCAHDADGLATVTFSNVKLTRAPSPAAPVSR